MFCFPDTGTSHPLVSPSSACLCCRKNIGVTAKISQVTLKMADLKPKHGSWKISLHSFSSLRLAAFQAQCYMRKIDLFHVAATINTADLAMLNLRRQKAFWQSLILLTDVKKLPPNLEVPRRTQFQGTSYQFPDCRGLHASAEWHYCS